MAKVKYILLTILKGNVRVAIGIQYRRAPLVYWMDRVKLKEIGKYDDFASPYVMYEGSLTQKEGKEILQAAEADDLSTAVRLFKKYFRGEESDKVYVEDEEWRPISEEVHDDWYDECDEIMSLMCTNIRGVLTYVRRKEYC